MECEKQKIKKQKLELREITNNTSQNIGIGEKEMTRVQPHIKLSVLVLDSTVAENFAANAGVMPRRSHPPHRSKDETPLELVTYCTVAVCESGDLVGVPSSVRSEK